MGVNLNLNSEFRRWFDENDCLNYRDTKLAFMAAARIVAQDTIDTLHDYSTACAGLGKESVSPEQIYDRVAGSLLVYYTQVLNKE